MITDSTSFDFCILGGGLAGLTLADALQEKGQNVIVIEKSEIGSGASGTPGALVNPATGRKGKKSWKAEICYKAIYDNLEKIQKTSSRPFFHQNGVLRPAQTEKMALKMKKQFDKTDWPEGWCEWLTENEIKQKHPGINCVNGGLWLPFGITVNGNEYVKSYTKWLQQKGVDIRTNCASHVDQKKDYWLLQTNQSTLKCEKLIFATGYGTISNRFWNYLKLEPIKGQLAAFQTDEKLQFNHSVSGLGYVANVDVLSANSSSGPKNSNQRGKFVIGSTYEHDFEDLKTDEEGAKYLRKRLKKMLPELADSSTLIYQWNGVRVSAPNRKPVIGEHPNYENLYVFTGLGSKGLLYSKFVANHFASHLVNKTPLFKEISINRINKSIKNISEGM